VIARWILAVGVLALFPVQAALEAAKPPPPTVVQTLPPAVVLPILAAGHRETVGDLLEIRATNFVIGTLKPGLGFTDESRDHLFRLFDGVLTLDPNSAGACWRGAILVGAFGRRANAAVALLKRGLGEPFTLAGVDHPPRQGVFEAHPRRWRLFHEQAATHLLMHAQSSATSEERNDWIRLAGKLFVKATEAGGPVGFAQVGRIMEERGLNEKEALAQEFELWKDRLKSGNEFVRTEARRRLKEARSRYRCVELQGVINQVRRNGLTLHSLQELIRPPVNLRAEALEDPMEVGFLFIDGKVHSPGAEAARLSRSLTLRLSEARSANAGAVPSLRDLHPTPLPPYLEAEITAEGRVVVKPRR
jgi:hypothetical protein